MKNNINWPSNRRKQFNKFNYVFESIMKGISPYKTVEPDPILFIRRKDLKLAFEDIQKPRYVISESTRKINIT